MCLTEVNHNPIKRIIYYIKIKGVYLCGQCLDRFQVEVVVKMQVVEVLTVNEQIEHVVALSAHLQPNLNPVQLGGLKELGGLERAEQVPKTNLKKTFTQSLT